MSTSPDSDVEIVSPVPDDEFVGWAANLWRTFLNPPDPERIERSATFWRERLSNGRSWGARADGQWVATLGADVRRLSVPAGVTGTCEVAVDALTGVTTSATHRRRGLLSAMLNASLRAAADDERPLSILVAAEWPIYGRFGYGPAIRAADYEYRPRARGATISPSGRGTVRNVSHADIAHAGPDVFDRFRRLRAGQIDRPPFWWRRFITAEQPEPPLNRVVHETDGELDGWLAWAPEGEFGIDGSLAGARVADLVATTPDAYRDLWAYLAGIDVVDRITLRERPVDEAARWLLGDGRALRETFAGDFVWVRLLDVEAAFTARGYACAGRVVIEVHDDAEGGYAAGRYVLEAGEDGTGSCRRTDASADVRLPATVLASGYLGGYQLSPIVAAGLGEELTPGAIAQLDAMLAVPVAPWCGTGF